jgi:prepilin-type N-terminal cleavage/methylation domain-containing protein
VNVRPGKAAKGAQAMSVRKTQPGNGSKAMAIKEANRQPQGNGPKKHPAANPQAGFSLLELLVASVIMLEVMYGVLILFDSSTDFARMQTNLAQMQQAQRVSQNEVVRVVRMAGIGGLPTSIERTSPTGVPIVPADGSPGFMPNGLAVALVNNSLVGAQVPINATENDDVVEGSDILILRGAFETPIYYLAVDQQQALDISTWYTPDGSGHFLLENQVITVRNDLHGGLEQPLDDLIDRIDDAFDESPKRPEALIVRDTLNPSAYAVLELIETGTRKTPYACGSVLPDGTQPMCIDIGVRGTNATHFAEYGLLTRGTGLLAETGGKTVALPDGSLVDYPKRIGSISFLDEYRFYLRADTVEQPMEDGTGLLDRLTPTLVRARFLPGTNFMIEEDRVDIAENVWDFQVAFGFDLDGDGLVEETPGILSNDDGVLFNHEDDTDGGIQTPTSIDSWARRSTRLFFLRLNTLVGVESFDRAYQAKVIGQIEDIDREDDYNEYPYTTHRRRLLTTVVDLRNQ